MDIANLHEMCKKQYGITDDGTVKYTVPSGSLLLDEILVVSGHPGGYPSGRVIEIYGPEQSGKTTMSLHAMIEAQKMGIKVGIIDLEAALDIEYFTRLGIQGEINVDWMHIIPNNGEDAFEILEMMVDSDIGLIVVDSVAAMTPKAEIEGDMGDSHMGLQARLMSQGMRKLVRKIHDKNCIVIFINQVRMKIGVMFGSPETTTGGNALKFWSSIRLDIRQVGDPIMSDDGKGIVGRVSKITTKKNKLGPPLKVAMVPIIFGVGVAKEIEILDRLVVGGLISKKSSYFYYKDYTFAGKKAVHQFIRENYDQLVSELRSKHVVKEDKVIE